MNSLITWHEERIVIGEQLISSKVHETREAVYFGIVTPDASSTSDRSAASPPKPVDVSPVSRLDQLDDGCGNPNF